MKIMKRTTSALVLIGLLASTLLFNGCGRKEAVSEGCPAGSFVANSTDKISDFTLAKVDRFVYATDFVAAFGVPYIPEPTFVVTDETGAPRNKVCLVLTTNGFWWADNSYTSMLFGTGINNQIIATTDDNGTVTVHWTTYPLPLSSAATSTAADGSPQNYPAALIGVSSGAVSRLISADITVKGCPKESFGIAPGSPGACP
jgi:hypothetical protein